MIFEMHYRAWRGLGSERENIDEDSVVSPAAAARRIESWEHANVENYGLADAMIGAAK